MTTPTAVEGAVAELSGSRADTVRVSDQRTAVSPPTLGDRFSRHLSAACLLLLLSILDDGLYLLNTLRVRFESTNHTIVA